MIGRLFPPDLFEMFIDVGHYVRELNAYKPLVDKISTLTVNIKEYWHAECYAYRFRISDEEAYLHELNREDF